MNYEKRNARLWQQNNPYESLQAAVDSGSSDDSHEETPRPSNTKETTNPSVANRAGLPGHPSLPPNPSAKGKQPRNVPPAHRPTRAMRPLRVTLYDKKDNAAKAAFRQSQPPTKKFILGKPSYLIEGDRRKIYSLLEEMGVRFGSYIRPPQNLLDRTLLLWGDERQTANTYRELQEWVLKSETPSNYNRDSGNPLKGKDKFSKEFSTLTSKYEAENKKLKIEARLQRYQQVPAAGASFQYIGYFLWPRDEVHPQELLGQSCEAFDPIRMHCRAHIIFESRLSLFKILSDDGAAIQSAIKRIEGTMREFVARNNKPVTLYVIEPPTPAAMQQHIKMLKGPPLTEAGNPTMLPILTGGSLALEELKVWFDESQKMTDRNNYEMQHALHKAIARLPYYRGRVQMRVLLGIFALSVFRWSKETKSITFEKFRDDMRLSNSKGAMIRNLNLKIGAEQIIAHCCQATGVFLPVSAQANTLEEVIPIHTAHYNFRFPEVGPVKCEIEMNKTGGMDVYEVSRKQWTKRPTEADPSAQPPLLELFMTRLQEGISWKLQISNENFLDPTRINPKMTTFADSVQFRYPTPNTKIELTGHRLFYEVPSLRIESFEQKTALRYRLKNHSSWLFEISRYDSYAANESLPSSTQWAATFWNSKWDAVLAENANLSIGQVAAWDPKLSTFFEAGHGSADMPLDAGFQEFIQNLRFILEVLDGMKSQDG